MNPLIFYKCLADETRLRSLLLITCEGELCVCELTEALGESQPKVSRHLAQLRSCGLLEDRRQGQWVFYRLAPSVPDWTKKVLQRTLDAERTFIDENLRKLHRMGDRPERARICC
ncbi:metalloregulator ArsR/SmtB family transcription factor [Microbulbifer taiwanensis]|uniref:Metalloregulator ArsR/SmtB family transcription factor n=1 Tax=Microbulbifer taiwanensis TaxID=986746 RepID=A0ABW1YUH0_9GAMM|nr:metalloregulator ArsR/SmtB family transcription factor [Microbulbifer taiwanensis]